MANVITINFRSPLLHIFLVLLFIGFGLFTASLQNDFVFDDIRQIVNNPLVHSPSNIPEFFMGSTFFSGGALQQSGGFYRPIMSTVFSILYSFFGDNPTPFHFFQIMIHICNSYLVYLVFTRYFKHFLALGLSIVFLIHPINVETVVYISNTQDVLFVFFGLLSWLLVENKRAFFVLLLLSLLSKETGVVFAVLLFGVKLKQIIPILIVYFLFKASAIGLLIPGNQIIPIANANLFVRFLTFPRIFFHYLYTYLYPKELHIMPVWIVPQYDLYQFLLPFFGFILVGLGFILIGAYAHKKKKHWKNTFILFSSWFWIGVAIHSHVIPLDATVADRWFYFTQIGLLGLFGIIVSQIRQFDAVKMILFCIIFVLLFTRSYMRISDWKTEYILTRHDIVYDPTNFLILNALGYQVMKLGNIDESIVYLRASIAAEESWGTSWNNLGYAYELTGTPESLDLAYYAYMKAISLNRSYLAYANCGNLLYKQGKYRDSIELVQEGLRFYPQNPVLQNLFTQNQTVLNR